MNSHCGRGATKSPLNQSAQVESPTALPNPRTPGTPSEPLKTVFGRRSSFQLVKAPNRSLFGKGSLIVAVAKNLLTYIYIYIYMYIDYFSGGSLACSLSCLLVVLVGLLARLLARSLACSSVGLSVSLCLLVAFTFCSCRSRRGSAAVARTPATPLTSACQGSAATPATAAGRARRPWVKWKLRHLGLALKTIWFSFEPTHKGYPQKRQTQKEKHLPLELDPLMIVWGFWAQVFPAAVTGL